MEQDKSVKQSREGVTMKEVYSFHFFVLYIVLIKLEEHKYEMGWDSTFNVQGVGLVCNLARDVMSCCFCTCLSVGQIYK